MEATISEINVKPETLSELKKLILEVTQMKIDPASIGDTANLFNDCGLDSTSVVDLVIGVEQVFGVIIDEEDLDVALFQDLSKLGAYIEARQAEGD